MTEEPIGYRVSWIDHTGFQPFDQLMKAEVKEMNFRTEEEARQFHESLRMDLPNAIISLTPVYISRAKRNNKYKKAQSKIGADWHLQHRSKPNAV